MTATDAKPSTEIQQAELTRIYNLYRDSLLSKKYYAHKVAEWKRIDLWINIVAALASSSVFTGLALWKTQFGLNFMTFLTLAAAVVAILKPIIRPAEKIDRYSKLHFAYSEVYLDFDSLIADIRRQTELDPDRLKRSFQIWDRYRQLALQDDPEPNRKLLEKFQAEVNEFLPPDRLWLPSAQ